MSLVQSSLASQWLPPLPKHWTVNKLGFVTRVKARLGWKGLKAEEYIDDGYIFLSTPNIKETEIDFNNANYISEFRYFESPEIMLREGDVLIAKDGSTLGTVNVVRRLPRPSTVNSSIAVIRPYGESVNSIFLYYFLRSTFIQGVIRRVKGGMGVPHLFQADLRKFEVLLPPLATQETISDFLDRETARIDELIEKKERLISLLNERSRAVVAQLLTKGSRSASLTPTETDWYGSSPAHWTRARLSRLCNLQRGHDLPQQDRVDGSVPIVSSAGVTGYHNRAAVRGPGVVTGRYGTIGQAFYIEEDFWPLNTTLYVTSFNGNFPKFVKHVLELLPLASDSEKSAVPGINRNYIHTLRVVVPPVSEQREIVEKIELHESSVQAMTEGLRRMVDSLREYRTALISAAVTGQIDVRTYRREPEAVLETA